MNAQKRIKELGGGDYNAQEPKSFDADGRELPGGGGYKYFGAAKELPGVRELFQAEAPLPPRRTRGAMYKSITPDYYGYRDEDDGTLLAKEAAAERAAVDAALEEYADLQRMRKTDALAGIEDDADDGMEDEAEEIAALTSTSAVDSAALRSHVPVPSQEAIQSAILDYRKQQLASTYAM